MEIVEVLRMEYARRNRIPLPLDSTLLRLAKEIENTGVEAFPKNLKPSDDWKHSDESAGKVTAPKFKLFIVYIRGV